MDSATATPPCLASTSTIIISSREAMFENIPVCVSKVPGSLISSTPDLYDPIKFGFGPFHHDRPSLRQTEILKASEAVKYLDQNFIAERNFAALVEKVRSLAPKVRACYGIRLKMDDGSLARILATDALFLCKLLLEREEGKAVDEGLLGDTWKLENQVPILVLKAVLEIRFSSAEDDDRAESHLRRALWGFCMEFYPIGALPKAVKNVSVVTHGHLLGLLYNSLMGSDEGQEIQDPKSYVWHPFFRVFDNVAEIFLPNSNKAAPAKIKIPSASTLVRSGVEFTAVEKISAVRFTPERAALHLPAIRLGRSSDVVIRNLVAYEQYLIESRQLDRSRPSFASYVELMEGLAATEDDVRLLREREIIVVAAASEPIGDADVARLLGTGLGPLGERRGPEKAIDKAVREASEYCYGYWRVHSKEILKKCASVLWTLCKLVFFFTLTAVFCLSVVCSIFDCGNKSSRNHENSGALTLKGVAKQNSAFFRSCR